MWNYVEAVVMVFQVWWRASCSSFSLQLVLVCRNVEFRHPESQDQVCRQQLSAPLSPAELVAAEENFAALYCKPIELYNIILRRSIKNVSPSHRAHSHVHAYSPVTLCLIVALRIDIPTVLLPILQPLFTQRSLLYKINAKRNKRFDAWMTPMLMCLALHFLF